MWGTLRPLCAVGHEQQLGSALRSGIALGGVGSAEAAAGQPVHLDVGSASAQRCHRCRDTEALFWEGDAPGKCEGGRRGT